VTDAPDLHKVLEALEAAYERKMFHRLAFFEPYEKQLQFFENGSFARERLFMAGNQLGKTEAGAFETACHLTGEYPDWWMGRRFDHATTGWAAGVDSTTVRDAQQFKLCGKPGVEEDHGKGYIPRSAFVDRPTSARGIADAFDTVRVRHVSGGVSTLQFKSYEQGREKFQASTIDFLWWDEEPPAPIYSEGLTRITATKGIEYMTFTPLKGMSNVVSRFLNEPSPDRAVTNMVIEEALHIDPKEIARIIAGYPAHERDARSRGIPLMGEGRVFMTPEESIRMGADFDLAYMPAYWVKLWGIDFGIAHPFAAVLIAWDKDNDVIYVLNAIRMKDARPIEHAAAMKPIGVNVPVAWPQDGTQRDKGSGEQLAPQYKVHGLKMLDIHAQFEDGGNSTEAGILEMDTRMATGRLKVSAHLTPWFEEYRQYHRKDGQIVKVNDDLMSATRIAVMMKRYARAVALGGTVAKRRHQGSFAIGANDDPFATGNPFDTGVDSDPFTM